MFGATYHDVLFSPQCLKYLKRSHLDPYDLGLRIGLSCDTLKGAVKRDPDSSSQLALSHFVLTRKWAYPASFFAYAESKKSTAQSQRAMRNFW